MCNLIIRRQAILTPVTGKGSHCRQSSRVRSRKWRLCIVLRCDAFLLFFVVIISNRRPIYTFNTYSSSFKHIVLV